MTSFATNKLTKVKILAFLVTVALVFFYDYIPKRTLKLLPATSNVKHITIDAINGGNSKFTWLDEDNYKWICDYKTGAPYPYCNLSISWSAAPYKQINFSHYTHLSIDLEYEGTAEYIRMFIRNYHQHPTNLDQVATGKFNTLTKPVKLFNDSATIYLKDLRVADWWVDEFNVPPDLIMPDVRKAIAVGIDIPNPVSLGEHRFHLKSINAVGDYFYKESLYFSIIVFWTILLLGEVLFRYISLNRKSQVYRKLLSRMSEQNELYKKKAETDKLTKILNREGLTQIIGQLQSKDLLQQYALMVLDLDHFKQVNDINGHAEGDKVLQYVAQIISNCMRSYDLVARWGGEEFVVLFHCLNNEHQLSFAEEIRKSIESSNFNNQGQKITISIGVAKFKKSASFEDTFKLADKALYKAKEQGRNKSVINADL